MIEKDKECGIKLDGFEDFQIGDTIEAISFEQVRDQFDDSIARGLNRDVPQMPGRNFQNRTQYRDNRDNRDNRERRMYA